MPVIFDPFHSYLRRSFIHIWDRTSNLNFELGFKEGQFVIISLIARPFLFAILVGKQGEFEEMKAPKLWKSNGYGELPRSLNGHWKEHNLCCYNFRRPFLIGIALLSR